MRNTDIFKLEESEDLIALESEITQILVELNDIELEAVTLENDYTSYETAKTVIFETFTNEYEQKFAFENIQDEENSVLTKIVNVIKKFIDKLKELWGKIILWIKTQFIEIDAKWYSKYREKMNIGIEHATSGDTVKVKSYAIQNPSKEISSDITTIHNELESFYTEAKSLVTEFINPNKSKSILQKLKEKFGKGSVQHQLTEKIKEQWESVAKACRISDMNGTLTGFNVRETVMKKYYGGKGQSVHKEVAVKDFAPDIDVIDGVLLSDKVESFRKTCEIIKNGSTELGLLLNQLDKYIKSGLDTKHDKDLEKDITDGKLGAIHTIRGTLSICNTIGSTYWNIYMGIRADIKKCVNIYIKIANKNKNKQ
jgi:hypothetical protein